MKTKLLLALVALVVGVALLMGTAVSSSDLGLFFCNYGTPQKEVGLILLSPDLQSLEPQVHRYAADAEAMNPDLMCEVEIGTGLGSPSALRDHLIQRYNDHSGQLAGVILVGNWTLPEWEFPWGEVCPLPLYYQDLDAQFNDTSGNGLFDTYTRGPNPGPEIWVAFMTGYGDDREGTLSAYFDKLHDVYSGWPAGVASESLLYIADDWSSGPDCADELFQLMDASFSTVRVCGSTSDDEYLHRLDERAWACVNVWSHASSSTHHFDTGVVNASEIVNLCADKGSLLTLIWGCHAGNLHEASNQSIAQAYVFADSVGLTSLAAVRSIGLEYQEVFLNALQGHNIARAYKIWLDHVYDEDLISARFPQDELERFVWDFILFGDPLHKYLTSVSFPDPGLEAAVRNAIGKPTGGILASDLAGLTILNASDRHISDLTGIEYCVDLVQLNLRDNQISDLVPLAGLTNLELLFLWNNQISDLTPLAGLTALTELVLDDNQIADVSPLAGLTALTKLCLWNNQISNLTPLTGLTAIRTLDLRGNQITDLEPLVSNTGIAGAGVIVDIRHNYLCLGPGEEDEADLQALLARGVSVFHDPQIECRPDGDVVHFPDPGLEAAIRNAIGKPTGDILQSDLVGLTKLRASSWGISDLTGLEYCVDLAQLYLWRNQISDLTPLAGLTNLMGLFLEGNQITDLTPLASLTNLTDLTLFGNQITDLTGLAGLTNLTDLRLGGNPISDLTPLAGLTNLTSLWLPNSPISDLTPLASLTNLTDLRLGDNPISDLTPLAGLSALTTLGLSYNQISDLAPLAELTGLLYLNLAANQISDLTPLAGLINLTSLWLNVNQIADLTPLSGLTSLRWLYLGSNQITDISALVSNSGIGSGDTVDLRYNYLCLGPGEEDEADLQALLGRGVNVKYDPQTECRPDLGKDTPAVFRVDSDGNVFADGTLHSFDRIEGGSADVAEWVLVSEDVEPGDVLELDPRSPMTYRRSSGRCSTLVAGVVSTQPGLVLGTDLLKAFPSMTPDGGHALLALVGIVPVKVTNEGGVIQPGDLLVASSTPGHAMKWHPSMEGCISLLGKALEPMSAEEGVILVLLTSP